MNDIIDTFAMPTVSTVGDGSAELYGNGGPYTGMSSQKAKRRDFTLVNTPDADIFLTEDGDVTE